MFGSQTQTASSGTDQTLTEYTEIRIDALGRTVIEGKGYTGDACSILGDKLRKALGGNDGDKTDKPEAFETDAVGQDEHW